MCKKYELVGICDNTDCEQLCRILFEVELINDFNNDICIWCHDCIKRDRKMVKAIRIKRHWVDVKHV